MKIKKCGLCHDDSGMSIDSNLRRISEYGDTMVFEDIKIYRCQYCNRTTYFITSDEQIYKGE